MSNHNKRSEASCRQAIVLGASVAGLLAARVLSEHFERVLVLDSDQRPYPGHPRKGAPQGHHPHLLLQGGHRVFERLFPGLAVEAQRDGVNLLDFAQDVKWWQHGGWKARFPSAVRTPSQTRPVLEERIRQRVAALPNVRFAWRSVATDLSYTPEGERVNGVWARLPDQGLVRLDAALVVDASGCGSRLPRWLVARGYEAPPEDRDPIGLVYTSGLFRRRTRTPLAWRALLLPPESRRAARGGMVLAIDALYVQVSLHGYGGVQAPTTVEGFAEYSASLPGGEVRSLLREAVLVSDLERYAVPDQTRRRYESMRRFPAGLLALGDSLCRFDPAYAQGMSVAALQAEALAAVLKGHQRRGQLSAALSTEYLARASRIVDLPWRMSGAAARVASSAGRGRSTTSALRRWYRRELELAAVDLPQAQQALLEVWHMVASESRLLRPALVARVLARAVARRRQDRIAGAVTRRRRALENSGALRLATASDSSAEIALR